MATQKLLYRIKGCGCDCATMPADPCVPCNSGAYQIQCRTRSGSTTLCGYSEFTSPSLPPKKYLLKTHSGRIAGTVFEGSGCGGTHELDAFVNVAGSSQYTPVGTGGPDSCVLAINLTATGDDGSGSQTAIDWTPCNWNNQISNWGAWSGLCGVVSETRTQRIYRNLPESCDAGVSYSKIGLADQAIEQLTMEHTEEAAMALSTAPWGAWGSCLSACTSKSVRGPGVFTLNFTEAQYRIRVAGAPGTLVHVELSFTRSGGAPFTEVYQDTATALAFPTDPEAGWTVMTIESGSGQSTCLVGSRLVTV
jgi:hypothetical protein